MSCGVVRTVTNNKNNTNDNDDADCSTHHPAKSNITATTSIAATVSIATITVCTNDNNNNNNNNNENNTKQHTNNSKNDSSDTINIIDNPRQVPETAPQISTEIICTCSTCTTNKNIEKGTTNTTTTSTADSNTIDIGKLCQQFEQDGYICLYNILQNYQDWYVLIRQQIMTTPPTETSTPTDSKTMPPTTTTTINKEYNIFTDYEQLFLDTFQSLYNFGHTKFPQHCQYQYPTTNSPTTSSTSMLDCTVNYTTNTTIISTTDTDNNINNDTDNITLKKGTKKNYTSESNNASNHNNNISNNKNDTGIRQIDKTNTNTTLTKQQQLEYNIVYSLGIGIKNGFSEIVMRSPGRYELSLYHITSPTTACSTSSTANTGIEQIVPFINELKKQLWFVPLLLVSSSSSSSSTEAVPAVRPQSSSADRSSTTGTTSGTSSTTINEVNYNLWDNNTIHIINISLVIGTPGCIQQSWHSDGRHISIKEHKKCHVLNIFIPLHTITNKYLGPTEYRPKSHYYTRSLTKLYFQALITKSLSSTIIPLLNISDIIIFDYRILHRGTANTMIPPPTIPVVDSTSSSSANSTSKSTNNNFRTYLVITVAQSWFYDKINFPKRSMYD